MSKDSYVQIPADKLTAMCDETLEWIYAQRAKSRESYILGIIEESEKNFFRKLFRCKVISREKAEHEYIHGDHGFFTLEFWVNTKYGKSEGIAKKLKLLASHGDPVQVSGEDLEHVA